MRADNTKHLLVAAQQRSDDARHRAERALEQLIADQRPLTVSGLARAAGVARSWLYTQPDLLDQLQRRASNKTTLSTSTTRASDSSLQRRLELAHQRISQQAEQITQLRAALARAHGDLRAATITPRKLDRSPSESPGHDLASTT
ncbi:DUF6262 family protein [Kribbella sp. NBC_01505]|uniref:DUF6262 family protein n=1 Tax=Kribbella sp. NBC_01505 TaxID=2903580 RepID=UPI00386CF841